MAEQLDTIFAALADSTRRSIVEALQARDGLSVGEIAAPFDMSLPAVSKHLDVLEAAGLVSRERRGRSVICRLDPAPMEVAMAWLAEQEQFWTKRLDALAAMLEDKSWPKTSRSALSEPSKPRRKKSSQPGPIRKR